MRQRHVQLPIHSTPLADKKQIQITFEQYSKGWYFILDGLLFTPMTHVAKVIDLIGSSDKSWQDAAQAALNEAKKTIHGITGIEVGDMTAKVDPNSGNITEYHTAVKIAFGVEH
jgi:flavin-binding protein dodecin